MRDAAINLLQQAIAGKLDWQAKKAEKLAPVKLNMMEQMMAFNTSMAVVAGKAGSNYPAPVLAVKTMQKHATMTRDDAMQAEAAVFAKAAVTPQANALIVRPAGSPAADMGDTVKVILIA